MHPIFSILTQFITRQLAEEDEWEWRRQQVQRFAEQLFETSWNEPLRELTETAEWVELRGGQRLFDAGETADSMYMLISGRLQILVEDTENKSKVIAEIERGELVGEMALYTTGQRSAAAFAMRDSVLVKIGQAHYRKMLFKYPKLNFKLSKLIIERLLRSQNGEQRYPIISKIANLAIVPASQNVDIPAFVNQLLISIRKYGHTMWLTADRFDGFIGKDGICQTPGAGFIHQWINNWLDKMEQEHEFVLLVAEEELTEWTKRCIRQADKILLVANADDRPRPGVIEQWIDSQQDRNIRTREDIVLIQSGETVDEGISNWLASREIDQHYNVRMGKQPDLDRLARIMTGNGVGLVLSGGGALGAAHVGVYKALVEAGIEIDMIGGTSIGAIIGGMIAQDKPYETILANTQEFLRDKNPLNDYTVPFISLYRGHRLNKVLKHLFPGRIEQLWKPFFCMSSDFNRAQMVIHERGLLWKSIRASVSLPGILPPVILNGQILIDGGLLNNLPVDIMRQQGVGKIIAVDLREGSSINYQLKEGNMPVWHQLLRNRFKRRRQNQDIPPFPGIVDILVGSSILGSIRYSKSLRHLADIYLTPPTIGYGLLDWKKFDEILEKGYLYAKEQLKDEGFT